MKCFVRKSTQQLDCTPLAAKYWSSENGIAVNKRSVMISSSSHPFWVGDDRQASFIDSSKISNVPITNQSTALISNVKIHLQVFGSLADTNKAQAWWNGAQSLGRYVSLLSTPSSTQWGSFNSARATNISRWSPVTDGSFDLQDKGDFEAESACNHRLITRWWHENVMMETDMKR